MLTRMLAVLAAATVLSAMPASAEDYAAGAIKTMNTDKGEVFVGDNGMTLYVFDKDAKDQSNCYGDCATLWPPFVAAKGASAAGDFTLVSRKDGMKQWAYDGKPLYFWQKDKKPGDTTGDGVKGVWHVAKDN